MLPQLQRLRMQRSVPFRPRSLLLGGTVQPKRLNSMSDEIRRAGSNDASLTLPQDKVRGTNGPEQSTSILVTIDSPNGAGTPPAASGAASVDPADGNGQTAAVDKPSAPLSECKPPVLSPIKLLVLFLGFGMRAFGGPVAQINLMRDELVDRGRWITVQRFSRVYAAYQVLPGPEATELAVYFGVLAGGRIGGLVAGLGFISPGIALMLLFSWFYSNYGITNAVFVSVFRGIQPAVSAMVFRAATK